MGYHHLALFARDIRAIHDFYETLMGFELVKVEVQPHGDGWAKHFFYRMEDDSKFIAFWELHDVPGAEDAETNLSKAAGVPEGINHIAFDVHSREDLDARRAQWQGAGLDVLEIDHNWCRSIYTKDPNGNTVEFCLTTGSFDAADRARALEALTAERMDLSAPPGGMELHKAATA
ncbi:MAG TPA: VOC family protein [Pseudomonadales bacterium]|nr:VOC family protein [Pseudomonadales bacterium]